MNSILPDLSNATDQTNCGDGSLTDSYGWLIQGILAALAFALLIVKRFCEPQKHRRSWIVWFYDTSKQGFGAALIHFSNVFLADGFPGDPCTWYIVSFLLDSTVGLGVMWAGIRFSIFIGRRKHIPTILFGEYGRPPSARFWMHQCLVYFVIMLFEKFIITALMTIPIWHGVRDLILAPFPDHKLRVAVSVLIIPFFVNALVFWVTDNFLMLKVRPSDLVEIQSTAAVRTRYQTSNGQSRNPQILFTRKATNGEDNDELISFSSNDDELLGTKEDLVPNAANVAVKV